MGIADREPHDNDDHDAETEEHERAGHDGCADGTTVVAGRPGVQAALANGSWPTG